MPVCTDYREDSCTVCVQTKISLLMRNQYQRGFVSASLLFLIRCHLRRLTKLVRDFSGSHFLDQCSAYSQPSIDGPASGSQLVAHTQRTPLPPVSEAGAVAGNSTDSLYRGRPTASDQAAGSDLNSALLEKPPNGRRRWFSNTAF